MKFVFPIAGLGKHPGESDVAVFENNSRLELPVQLRIDFEDDQRFVVNDHVPTVTKFPQPPLQ